jgi:hypothetical protein
MAPADLAAVLDALTAPRHSLRDSLPTLPDRPGLYAIYGDEQAWDELRLGEATESLLLYVGKAEDSLVKRDIRTHFGNGRTGSSTVRRSFAALLRDDLALTAQPRNPAKPSHFSMYGLAPADDGKLTRWMRDRLEIAAWATDGARPLAEIEGLVLGLWRPPINIQGVEHRWKASLQAARRVMADEAKAWRPTTDS